MIYLVTGDRRAARDRAALASRLRRIGRSHGPGGRRPAEQLVDCATSVAANYRASARARSRDDFIARLGVVNKEADEAVYWLEFMKGASLADAARVDELLAEAKELRAIFAASCRTARRNHRGRRTNRS